MENKRIEYTSPRLDVVELKTEVKTDISGFNIESNNSNWLFS